MLNCTALWGVWVGVLLKDATRTNGYYMLLTITTPGVRDHHSDREVSTALFLPANIGSMAGELPWTLQYLRAVNITTIQENMESSPNIKFRAAVQFMQLS